MGKPIYPYIPNSVPEQRKRLLREIGIESIEEIFREIPDRLRFKGKMKLPEPFLSEYGMRRHVEGLLAKNKDCKDYISFLGGGIWQHYVPAVCDTIASRDEFLTAYVGDSFADHGKFQSLFETASMIGDLVGMDVVSTPTYDWANAAAISIRMASRINGRKDLLVPRIMGPGRSMVVQNYCKPDINVTHVGYHADTGLLDVGDLKRKISANTAAVYIENPTYLGFIESQVSEISKITHDSGAILIVGADPTSLGVLTPPSEYGADIVCGELQPLGMHMQWGGGLAGYIATHDKKEYVAEYPSLLFGLTTTTHEGEYGFGEVFYDRTSYASREKGKDFIGTTTALYGIVAGVYLALMGPQGMRELGEGIMQRVQYTKNALSGIEGINTAFDCCSFKEFVVNFDATGKSVKEINKALLDKKIFGGKDLKKDFPELGNSALYCVTEVHTKEDIDKLAEALGEICR